MSVITVSNTTDLLNAIRNARGGETILLTPGNYGVLEDGRVTLKLLNTSFSSNVTIASADPANKAHVDHLRLWNMSNVTFRDLDFGHGLEWSWANFQSQITVEHSHGIKFDGIRVHGSLDGNPTNDRNGISVLNSTGVSVTGSEFLELNRALLMGSTSNIDVSGNNFHDLRLGGVHFADAQHVRITGNSFKDFFPIGDDHPDAIQFWEAGTSRANSDILISDNVILQGRGRSLQGIFLGDDIDSLVYTDVRITNNLIYIDGWEAIAVEGRSRNVLIDDNTAVSRSDDQYAARILVQQMENGVVRDNVTDVFINQSNGGLQLSNNLFLNEQPGRVSDIRGIGLLANATPESFVTQGVGYQLTATPPTVTPPPVAPPPPPPPPPPVTPPPVVTPSVTSIYGTTGNNIITGTVGADLIWGVPGSGSHKGRGTVDRLIGNGGEDTFVLGDSRGIFYDDGRARSMGTGDYANIIGFGRDDKLQLDGVLSEYVQRPMTLNGVSGLGIFHDSNGNGALYDTRDELIALLQGVTVPLDPTQFVFV